MLKIIIPCHISITEKCTKKSIDVYRVLDGVNTENLKVAHGIHITLNFLDYVL